MDVTKGDRESIYVVGAVALVGVFVLALVAWAFMASTNAQNAATLSAQAAVEQRSENLTNLTWWTKISDAAKKVFA